VHPSYTGHEGADGRRALQHPNTMQTILFCGPPRSGKTTTARLIARMFPGVWLADDHPDSEMPAGTHTIIRTTNVQRVRHPERFDSIYNFPR
jgi:DNA polymerase III delta prime subunit